MNVTYVVGDIVEAIKKFDNPEKLHVAHGANCMHTMGAGVAKALNEHTNGSLLEADKKSPYGDINKLGFHSKLIEENRVRYYNCYTQHGLKKGEGVYVHWHSVGNALLEIIFHEMKEGDTLFIPKIGSGLAGGSDQDFKDAVASICYNTKIHNCNYDLVIFSL